MHSSTHKPIVPPWLGWSGTIYESCNDGKIMFYLICIEALRKQLVSSFIHGLYGALIVFLMLRSKSDQGETQNGARIQNGVCNLWNTQHFACGHPLPDFYICRYTSGSGAECPRTFGYETNFEILADETGEECTCVTTQNMSSITIHVMPLQKL